jgi:hypothetical protein
MVDVIPVSDPNAATMTQRLVQYQAVIQLSQTAPQIYNLPELHRGMLDVLGIKNADKLVPLPSDQKPQDPVTENMNILQGKPVKAFLYQDHEAHIQVHMAAMQDPMIMQTVGQNPNAQAMMAAAQAHIAEHVAFAYRTKMEQMLGVQLPDPEDENKEGLPEQIEKQLSMIMPNAAQAVLRESQQRASQMQAQQRAQDPVIQMQQMEMQIKTERLALEKQKLQIEAAEKADKLNLEKQRLQVDAARYADKNATESRRNMAQEEIAEQRVQIDAMRAGTQSRAQDIAARQRDTEIALQTMQDLRQRHDANNFGESGQ